MHVLNAGILVQVNATSVAHVGFPHVMIILLGVPWLTYALAGVALGMLVMCLGRVGLMFKVKAEEMPENTAQLCKVTSFFFAFFLCTCASFFANNSSAWFLSPSTPDGQPCGLMIPTGSHAPAGSDRSNATAQYYDSQQNTWIWVDLQDANLSEIRRMHWEYTDACVNVFSYDIVTSAWAKECSTWCQNHFGRFIWNEACAFGLIQNENPKPMNVLRACQKASFSAQHFPLSSDGSRKFCILIAMLSCCSGIALYILGQAGPEPTFGSTEKDGKLKLAPFVAIPCVSRKTEVLFDILKMAGEFILDTFSDFSAALMYFSHGQIFFGFYMLMVLIFSNAQDLFGTTAFRDLCWSLKHAVPHPNLIVRKASEVAEGFAGLVCVALFFLRVPAHDSNGEPLLSETDLVFYTITLITSMTGIYIYGGAEASIQAHVLHLQPECELDMDQRYDKFQDKSVLMTVFALTVLVCRVAIALTIALLLAASSTPFAKAKDALTRGGEKALAVALVITLVVIIAFACYKLHIPLKNMVGVVSSNMGFVSSAFASCFAAGYLQELRDQGDWDRLPWHDEWIHLSSLFQSSWLVSG